MYEAAFVKYTDRYSGRGAGIIWELSRSEGFGHPGAFTQLAPQHCSIAALQHRMTANSAAAKRVQCGADRLHSRAEPSPGYTVAGLHRRRATPAPTAREFRGEHDNGAKCPSRDVRQFETADRRPR